MRINDYVNKLLMDGVWEGPDKDIRNCDKCYNRRHLGKYLLWSERVKTTDGRYVMQHGRDEYQLCKCIKKALPKMIEEEKKRTIIAIDNKSIDKLDDMEESE